MGSEEAERIRKKLSALNLHPTYLEHEPVITSEDAAKTRGFQLKQGIKAILFTDSKESWVIACVPADKKVDQKKVAEYLGWSKGNIRMATEQEVMDRTGCQIGAVPPFGHKTKIPILVDPGVYSNETSVFNIGLRTHSLTIPTQEMHVVFSSEEAKEGNFAK